MANKFSSVEWLSRSSMKEMKTSTSPSSPEMPKDGKNTAYSWNPAFLKAVHVAPYSGTQRLTLSPSLWDSDVSTHSNDHEGSSCTLGSPRLSPVLPCADLPQGDLEASQKPPYNGLYNNIQNPTISQGIPTFNQEISERSTESVKQKNFSEDLSHSGKLSLIFMNNSFIFVTSILCLLS